MATRLEDADAMIAACHQNQVRLGVAFQSRTKPVFQRIRAAIQAGELGELTFGLVNLPYYRPQTYYDQAAWRGTWALDGGGVLMNQGIHQVDLLAWYMGLPVSVRAHALSMQRQIEVEDSLSASLCFANGALAAINASVLAAPGFPPRIEIHGTRGGVQVEGDEIIRWWSQDAPGAAQPAALSPASGGAGADPRGISTAGHIALIADFIQAVREDRPCLVDGEQGRLSLEIVISIYQAAGKISAANQYLQNLSLQAQEKRL